MPGPKPTSKEWKPRRSAPACLGDFMSEAYLEGMKTYIIRRAGTAIILGPKPTSKEWKPAKS